MAEPMDPHCLLQPSHFRGAWRIQRQGSTDLPLCCSANRSVPSCPQPTKGVDASGSALQEEKNVTRSLPVMCRPGIDDGT